MTDTNPDRDHVHLKTGQDVVLDSGVVRVLPHPQIPRHLEKYAYRLTVEHFEGGFLNAYSVNYDLLIAQLKQLEYLGYELRNITKIHNPKE